MSTYLNFSTAVSNSCKFTINGTLAIVPTIQYKINEGEWTNYTFGNDISLNANDTVYFKGDNNRWSISNTDYITFSCTASGAMGGNIMSLLDSTMASVTIPNNWCFFGLFYNCTNLTSPPELPATTLANNCYSNMLLGCTSLTTAPALPATTLKNSCYEFMFYGCTSLITAPALPATTLVGACYMYMFQNCTSLTTAPALPATTLESSCYQSMFQGCTSLVTAPELPATSLKAQCYASMFQGCTSLVTAPVLPATYLQSMSYISMFSGCSNLDKITVLYPNPDLFTFTSYWLYGVKSTGTFTCFDTLGTQSTITRAINACPTNWTVNNISDVPYCKSIVTSGLTTRIKNVRYLTQAEYDALTTKDYETEYRIKDYTPVTMAPYDSTATSYEDNVLYYVVET